MPAILAAASANGNNSKASESTVLLSRVGDAMSEHPRDRGGKPFRIFVTRVTVQPIDAELSPMLVAGKGGGIAYGRRFRKAIARHCFTVCSMKNHRGA